MAVDDIVHPDNRRLSEAAALGMGLDIAGVDLLIPEGGELTAYITIPKPTRAAQVAEMIDYIREGQSNIFSDTVIKDFSGLSASEAQDRFKQYAAAGASTAALVEMSGVIANKEARSRKRAIEQSQIARNINAKSEDAKAIEKSEAKIKEILKQMSEEGGASDNSES